MKIIVSLSGGLDSATVLGMLVHEGHEVECVAFKYPSKHNVFEVAAASDVARHYKCPFTVIDVTTVFKGFESALLTTGKDIPEGHYAESTMKLTVVPCRNVIFTSILAGLADSRGCRGVALGIHQGDHAVYPDCRPEFFDSMHETVQLATEGRVVLLAPLLYMCKAGIVASGLYHKVPYHMTRTCYKDQIFPCGKCGSCVERLDAFFVNCANDPILYE